MKKGEITPTAIVNPKRIKGLDQIRQEAEKDTPIGVLVTLSPIENSPMIQSSHPVLAQAIGLIGSMPIRNLETIEGNIGRASPASDIAPSLMVLQSHVAMDGAFGKKEIDIAELFTGLRTTNLSAGEVTISLILLEMSYHSGAAYIRIGRTLNMDYALVGIAAILTLGDNNTEAKEPRVALASVGPVPFREKKAEEVLLSGSLTEKRVMEAYTDILTSASYWSGRIMLDTLSMQFI